MSTKFWHLSALAFGGYFVAKIVRSAARNYLNLAV